jgi:Uma2 family endonuclease
MGLAKLKPKISIEEYLEGEKTSEVRHEYLNGEVYAMAETSKHHNRIIRTLLKNMEKSLDGSGCEPFFVDIKVFVKKFKRFYYPDLLVVCGEDLECEYYTSKPTLLIEVLSPSTALTDRREKMFAYQEIESLQEYILIEQNKIYAEIYRRRDDGLWSWIEFDETEEIEFDSIKFKMPMTEIYEGVEIPPPTIF